MKRALLLALAFLGACAATQPESDWERANRDRLGLQAPEAEAPLPAYPKKEGLLEFYVSATTDFKYFIDAGTLSVSPRQGIVRYVMVARSPSGVDNVSYESIRCPEEYRVLAVGDRGKWDSRPGDWRPITKGTSTGRQYALARNYFCPHRDSIQTVAEGIDALRRGGHPAVTVDPYGKGGGS